MFTVCQSQYLLKVSPFDITVHTSVVGGNATEPGEFPHMVIILLNIFFIRF